VFRGRHYDPVNGPNRSDQQPKDKLNLLLLRALHQEDEGETMELTDVIYNKTSGNIFHSMQILEEMQRKKRLTFSHITSQWEWDLTDETLGRLLSNNVVEAVMGKISDTLPNLQRILVLAVYTRSGIDADTLCQLTPVNGRFIPRHELLPMLDTAVADGLLVNTMVTGTYRFAHDRIQEAGKYDADVCARMVDFLTDCLDTANVCSCPAYRMVPSGVKRDDLQLRLGHKLYKMSVQGSSDDWILFSAADHLNATSLEVDSDDPTFLIKLNLHVAERASSVAAYQSATKYLGIARQSLSKMDSPWEEYYDITHRVYQETVEAEMCLGNFEVGMAAGQTLLSRATSLEDKVPTYLAICHAFGRRGQHKEAYEMSLDVLRTMGAIPKGGTRVKIMTLLKDLLYARRFFARHSDADILAISILRDTRLEMIMNLWSVASVHAYYCSVKLDHLVTILRAVVISLRKGLVPLSGVALTGYSLVCCAVDDMKAAHRFSNLAREILTVTKAREETSLHLFIAATYVHAWQDPPTQIINIYESAYKVGMESGDLENALLSKATGYAHAFLTGYSLADLEMNFLAVTKKPVFTASSRLTES